MRADMQRLQRQGKPLCTSEILPCAGLPGIHQRHWIGTIKIELVRQVPHLFSSVCAFYKQ